jgi:outer membrane lipoprotein-sorting protein
MRILLAALAAALLLAAPAFAQSSSASKPPALTDKDRADLKRIETYLDGITTAKADFAQTSTTGKSGEGTFWLSRPGRLRFEFKAPSNDLIVADGTNITYWDAQLRSAQSAPIERTLANLFLRPKIQFGGELTVTSFEHFANVYRVEIAQANDVGAGRLTLVLLDQPLTLRQWRVTDAQNQVTDVTLSNSQFGLPLDPSLFVFQEPKRAPKAR